MRLGQVRMIEEITNPTKGMAPSAQVTLIPQAASSPVSTLKTMATQNLVLPTLVVIAIKMVTKLKTINPKKIALTKRANDSIVRKCATASVFF